MRRAQAQANIDKQNLNPRNPTHERTPEAEETEFIIRLTEHHSSTGD